MAVKARAKTPPKRKPRAKTTPRATTAARGGKRRAGAGAGAGGNGAAPGLLERLKDGAVICAEGYVFELERRGYLQAGAFVPEVLFEHPEVVEQLHLDFVHAGSDVTQALTYYVHREKLRVIGREK
ncbi:MAG: homocysteine S-methyltransferase family protein, partial [Sinobacteraceae bacterium]|nr:homocysteine S-methyltransferase family protein [Nevskiaceae bacterium]